MDIVGHQFQRNFLEAALENGRLSHAYLFTGPEGIGKKMVAEECARSLLERDGLGSSGELKDHPNVRCIGYEKEIGIDDIRDLKSFFQLKPFAGNARAVIIDNAHTLNREAANSFLKLLEEPPANSHFFLVTHAPDVLPKTIMSRAVMIRFMQVPKADISLWLTKSHGFSAVEAQKLAHELQGRPGWLTLLDGNKTKKMERIISGSNLFLWSDWSDENTALVSQMAMHELIQTQATDVKNTHAFARKGKKLIDTELLLAGTNANSRLAWEYAMWSL